jgi:hypothetical protein
MRSENHRDGSNGARSSDGSELPEKLNLTAAHKYLGISFTKMTGLVNNGIIKIEKDPLDNRVKLVKRADLDKLKRQRSAVEG